jgi:PAS domain S-box-containing protein
MWKMLHTSLDSHADASIVVDRNGIVRFVNAAAERLFKRKADELVGELFGLPVVAGERTEVDIIQSGGSIASAEMRVTETKGEDEIVYVIANLRDISDRKLAEESLRLRERAIAASSNGIVITDATKLDHPIIYINPGFERITGYTASDVIGHNCRMLQGQDKDQPDLQKLRDAIREGLECHAILRNYRKDGTQFWNDLYVAPVRDEVGNVTNFIGIQTDITERIQNEAQLRQQNEYERLLSEITLNIRQSLNLTRILQTTVDEVRRLLNCDRAVVYRFQPDWSGDFDVESCAANCTPIIGSTVSDPCFADEYVSQYQNGRYSYAIDLLDSDLTPCHIQLLQRFEVRANLVVPIIHTDNLWGLLIVHQCHAPRHWQQFEIDLLRQLADHVAIAINQAELFQQVQNLNTDLERQVEERTAELRQALAKEKELSELKTRFVSMASHEFRTPLATIQAASDLLKHYSHKMSEDSKQERIDKIQMQVKNMTELLEGVLTLGKVESGKLTLQPALTDLSDFCAELLGELSSTLFNHHKFDFAVIGTPRQFCLDQKLLRQLLTNLISNAIKYSPLSDLVSIKLFFEEDVVRIVVSDRGIGIPLEDIEHIFESFSRGSNVGTISGTGLGLAIAKASAELLGGKFDVQSQVNVGTVFTVSIPNQ